MSHKDVLLSRQAVEKECMTKPQDVILAQHDKLSCKSTDQYVPLSWVLFKSLSVSSCICPRRH